MRRASTGGIRVVRLILAVIGVVVLFGTGLAAQQVSLPGASPVAPVDAHAHAGHEVAPAPPSDGLAHAFTLNVYISDSGIDPSIVFVPAGRRVQLALRNLSMAEHHYRVAGLPAMDLLWTAEPSGDAAAQAEPSEDDDHMMHHARDFVSWRAASPAGIRPTGKEVHAYVSAMQIVDILLFTPAQPGTFAVQCDLHGETLGKMVVFDAGEPSPAPTTTHVAPPDNAPADALALPSPRGRNWLAWLAVAVAVAFGLLAWLAWSLRQDSQRRSNTLRWARATALILLGFVASWSWLFVVSRWGPEQRTDILTFKSGVTSKVMRALLKPAQTAGPHGHDTPNITGIYATPEYYLMTEQTQEAAKYQPEKFNVFYIFEDSHMGELPLSPPSVALRLADAREFSPLDSSVLAHSSHHRATAFRFPRDDAQGRLLIGDGAPFFELVAQESTAVRPGVVHAAMVSSAPMLSAAQAMRWDLPIVYPKDLQGRDLSLPTLLALLAGLLAVLSPCLLQLTVYYTFALTGIGMQQNLAGAEVAEVRSRVIRTALQFIAGFTIVFTAAGSLAGLAGQRLQLSGLMEQWSRPLGIAAGLGLLIVGVWVGSSAGAPGLCRLPLPAKLRARNPWLDRLKVMFMGSAFAVGCSTCFGGALFISLMIYVGAVGSPWLGAVSLFLFSLGIAVPYLLAAFFLSRALPLLNSLHKAASVVGLACSIVLIFFGFILITDNFHVPSNALYRLYLGL
jgi:cytochrome c-type biogenesis protein